MGSHSRFWSRIRSLWLLVSDFIKFTLSVSLLSTSLSRVLGVGLTEVRDGRGHCSNEVLSLRVVGTLETLPHLKWPSFTYRNASPLQPEKMLRFHISYLIVSVDLNESRNPHLNKGLLAANPESRADLS